jgi:ATP synthase j chain
MWPFMVSGLIVAYAINAGANAMKACKDPLSSPRI